MNITANWGKSEDPEELAKDAIFLMAGETCLGYVTERSEEGDYMGCVGAGIGAPFVYYGKDLEAAKKAVESRYVKPGQASGQVLGGACASATRAPALAPGRADYGTLDWMVERLQANRITGKEMLKFHAAGRFDLQVLSFYSSPVRADELNIDIGENT